MENLENSAVMEEELVETPTTDFVEEVDNAVEPEVVENQNSTEEPSAEDSEVASEFKKEDEEEEEDDSEEESEESESEESDEEEEEDENKKKYELLEVEYNSLQEKFSDLEAKYNELVAFKASIEDAQKDELINSFSMLSEDDKKDVVENKSKYSLDTIESKLSVLFARKQIAEAKEQKNAEQEEEAPIATFNMSSDGTGGPDWIKKVRATQESMNN